ncbi:scm-related gene containing four mbt domains isoform X1 [Rhipicephalus microplus]|uniref:scm-related gene containing four mbt domains isoform X1 n=2 Tax=Rhipicephalus microplus TaxID=6941 RepID=UPI003F6BCC14
MMTGRGVVDDDDDETTSSSDGSSSSSDSEAPPSARNGTKAAVPPIRKDGMAVCERCGTVGVKHAFYSKTKRYCSVLCSRGLVRAGGGKTSSSQNLTKRPLPQAQRNVPHNIKPKYEMVTSFDWKPYLTKADFVAAPVSCFKHAAFADCWDNVTVGMKVEVENRDCESFKHVFSSFYWIATVVKIAGYMAKLRYEGFGMDESKDFWVNLCIDSVYPVGWCAAQGKPLIPPKTIEHKHGDWKQFLVKRLTGARTLPTNFHAKVRECTRGQFPIGLRLEVVDKKRISSVRVARVTYCVAGRIHIAYEGLGDDGFWCHERSSLIHPIGWAQVIGHDLRASPEYAKSSLEKALLRKCEADEASWDMFPPVHTPQCELKFKEGMKLEAIDPLNLSTICVATVTKVLRNNYLMIGIDGMMAANGSDWFCYHASSPCIFPVGFCELNGIELTPPRGHKGDFRWFDYLRQTKSVAAPVALFKKDIPKHGFQEGMHAEVVDLMEPRLICVGRVTKVVGRLLRVHFDGWEDSYDQWCDCESPDLFPVGWCQMVQYPLEPPRQNEIGFLKKKKKYQSYKGPRRSEFRTQAPTQKKKMRFTPGSRKSGGTIKGGSPGDDLYGDDDVHTKPDIDDMVTSSSEASALNRSDNSVSASPQPTAAVRPLEVGEEAEEERVQTRGGLGLSVSLSSLHPQRWGVAHVARFLRLNDCASYCQGFCRQKVDGAQLLELTKESVMALTDMKVGPSLKIFDLIQQLKAEFKGKDCLN